ncbi:MAG: PspC domain-containing protein [Bacteroidetes bacterium]|nr:PspC domain-containing protein [Bacteroidota bacterium]
MNKLLYVNIGGLVFQIDETAYKKLDTYLNSIRKKYTSTPDGDEIIKDIEDRIAELFTEKVGERGAITDNYVDEIITIMGKPEDYEEEIPTPHYNNSNTQEKKSGGSKFYRDKEHNVLGGVCSGFAAKFNVDSLWIRLAFLIAFFFAGTGLLLYIILWIIIPEAKTTAEKLEMRGEKVDISNIEKTIKDGAKQFTTKVNEFGEEVKQTFSRENIDKSKKNAGDFIEGFAQTIKPAVQTVAKIFVGGVLIFSLLIVVVIIVELFSNWGDPFSEIDFLGNQIMAGSNQAWLLVASALALVIIPLLGLIFSSVKYLVGIKKKTRYVSGGLGLLWTVCLFIVIYLGITIGKEFRVEGEVSNKMDIAQPANNTLYVQLNDNDSDYYKTKTGYSFDSDSKHGKHIIKKDFWEDNHDWGYINVEENSYAFHRIEVEFEKSTDTNFVVLINKIAKGHDRLDAKENAQNCTFFIVQSGDSLLTIPSVIKLNDMEQWRDQQVYITIRVPMDKYVQINKNLEYCLDDNEYTSDLKYIELYDTKLRMTSGGLKPVL